jgi:hypothetical protein
MGDGVAVYRSHCGGLVADDVVESETEHIA